jgi:dihydroorotase
MQACLECEKENIFAKCGWSPLKAFFKSRITHTFVNGKLVYNALKLKIYELEKIVV